ncbi:contractile injection system protein, VgrG/Pvc8 family [Massilia sp. W12]|uniref:contractile injection system protein, VgrG/Pvc8 family n=1 Tax=Massilia sp. W12 TaxID=3126507 RepID=UPI0030CB9780
MNDGLNPEAMKLMSALQALKAPAPALYLHCAFFTADEQIIGDETFRLVSFEGQESVSELFEFQLELHGNTDLQNGAPYCFNDFIGRPLTVGIAFPCGDAQGGDHGAPASFRAALDGAPVGPELALFNGIVTSFAIGVQGVYYATMKPALHRLSLTNHYRIFKQKNIRDVIGDLLDQHRISYSTEALMHKENLAVARVQDWLQAGESDLEFLQRLLHKAHLFFFFEQSATAHTVVFANKPCYPPVLKNGLTLRYDYTQTEPLALAQTDVLADYNYSNHMISSGVQGNLTQQQPSWLSMRIAPWIAFTAQDPPDPGELPFRQYKIYQYGCSNDEASEYTDATASTLSNSASTLSGKSFCAHFHVGHYFSLNNGGAPDSPSSPLQPLLENRLFVLTSVQHSAHADGRYENQFQAGDADQSISPFSLQDTQQGSLLAVVVSGLQAPVQDPTVFGAPSSFDPEGMNFYDALSQPAQFAQMGVYVRFSTDAANAPPVWIRLSTSMQSVPTIGSTVVVARAQDESELPEIQNIVQTNGAMTVTASPSQWLSNTHVGNNYSTSYGDNQSINYGQHSSANLQQSSSIVSNAYASGKYDNCSFSQGASYSFSCADSAAPGAAQNFTELYGPYANASDLLSASESFGSNYSRQYAQVTSSYAEIGTSYNESVIQESISISTITTNTSTSTITTSTSTDKIELSNSDSTIGISNANSKVGVANSNSDTGIANSAALTGIANSVALTAMSNAVNLTGESNSINLTGESNAINLTGESNAINLTGESNNINLTGQSMNLNLSGENTNINLTGKSMDVSLVGMSNSANISGVSNAVSLAGATTNTTLNGVSVNTSIIGSSTAINLVGNDNTFDLKGPGLHFAQKGEQPAIEMIITRITLIEAIVIYL